MPQEIKSDTLTIAPLKCYMFYNEDDECHVVFAERYAEAKLLGRGVGHIRDGHNNWRDYISNLGVYRKLKRRKEKEPGTGAEKGEASNERYESMGMGEM